MRREEKTPHERCFLLVCHVAIQPSLAIPFGRKLLFLTQGLESQPSQVFAEMVHQKPAKKLSEFGGPHGATLDVTLIFGSGSKITWNPVQASVQKLILDGYFFESEIEHFLFFFHF